MGIFGSVRGRVSSTYVYITRCASTFTVSQGLSEDLNKLLNTPCLACKFFLCSSDLFGAAHRFCVMFNANKAYLLDKNLHGSLYIAAMYPWTLVAFESYGLHFSQELLAVLQLHHLDSRPP